MAAHTHTQSVSCRTSIPKLAAAPPPPLALLLFLSFLLKEISASAFIYIYTDIILLCAV